MCNDQQSRLDMIALYKYFGPQEKLAILAAVTTPSLRVRIIFVFYRNVTSSKFYTN